jgi:hypothetical protein
LADMPKQSAIDKAIESLDYQIAVLQMAKQKLLDQVKPKVQKVTKSRRVEPQTA